ncbi:hypothetical protein ACLOJK_015279 [Asimina triloba]
MLICSPPPWLLLPHSLVGAADLPCSSDAHANPPPVACLLPPRICLAGSSPVVMAEMGFRFGEASRLPIIVSSIRLVAAACLRSRPMMPEAGEDARSWSPYTAARWVASVP